MEYISLAIATSIITVLGSFLKVLLTYFNTRSLTPPNAQPEGDAPTESGQSVNPPTLSSAQIILIAFAVIVCLFGILTLIQYWDVVRKNADSFYFIIWLLLSMVGGMFVQVLATNYRAGRPLFQVGVSELIFPLLFSVIVFYPIWAIAASAEHSFFSIHAAFLNGYFWESVVSAARVPEPNGNQS